MQILRMNIGYYWQLCIGRSWEAHYPPDGAHAFLSKPRLVRATVTRDNKQLVLKLILKITT